MLCSFILEDISLCACRVTLKQVPVRGPRSVCTIRPVHQDAAGSAASQAPHVDPLGGNPPGKVIRSDGDYCGHGSYFLISCHKHFWKQVRGNQNGKELTVRIEHGVQDKGLLFLEKMWKKTNKLLQAWKQMWRFCLLIIRPMDLSHLSLKVKRTTGIPRHSRDNLIYWFIKCSQFSGLQIIS